MTITSKISHCPDRSDSPSMERYYVKKGWFVEVYLDENINRDDLFEIHQDWYKAPGMKIYNKIFTNEERNYFEVRNQNNFVVAVEQYETDNIKDDSENIVKVLKNGKWENQFLFGNRTKFVNFPLSDSMRSNKCGKYIECININGLPVSIVQYATNEKTGGHILNGETDLDRKCITNVRKLSKDTNIKVPYIVDCMFSAFHKIF